MAVKGSPQSKVRAGNNEYHVKITEEYTHSRAPSRIHHSQTSTSLEEVISANSHHTQCQSIQPKIAIAAYFGVAFSHTSSTRLNFTSFLKRRRKFVVCCGATEREGSAVLISGLSMLTRHIGGLVQLFLVSVLYLARELLSMRRDSCWTFVFSVFSATPFLLGNVNILD